MKKILLPVLGLVLLLGMFYLVNSDFSLQESEIAKLREQHEKHLKNSPFKESLKLSKKERKARGIPPNKFFERQWELTMDPKTGSPAAERVFEIQKELKQKALFDKVPGESVTEAWEERGPNNVGGRTRAIMYDPNDNTNKRVFAGGVSGGLWVNSDITDPNSGWTEVNIPQNLAISSLAYDPNLTTTFYAGTGESYVGISLGTNVNGNGLWKSVDSGLNWSKVLGGFSSNGEEAKITVNSPGSIADDYSGFMSSFGPVLSDNISGDLVLVNDGTISPTEGCKTLINGTGLNGNIAVIERGSCNFDVKVKNAQIAGAIAVLMINNVAGFPIIMGGDDPNISIPSAMISQADGQAIMAKIGEGVNITIEVDAIPSTGNFFISGIVHINDVVVRNNGGVSEVFVAAAESAFVNSTPFGVIGNQNYGLYKSSDGGLTWKLLVFPTISGITDPLPPNDLEIGADNTLWVSTNDSPFSLEALGGRVLSSTNGKSFILKTSVTDGERTEIAVSSTDANKIYVLAELSSNATNGVEIILTTDGFVTETSKSLPFDADTSIDASDFTRGQAWYDLMIAVDPSNDDIVYVGGIDLFRSSNGGHFWSQISKWSNNPGLSDKPYSLVHPDQHTLVFNPGNSNQGVIGNDGGVYFANSLSSAFSSSTAISSRNKDYNTVQFYSGSISNNENLENMLGGTQDNGSPFIYDANSGINESTKDANPYGGDGAMSFIDKTNSNYIISSTPYNDYYYSTFDGLFLYEIDDDIDSGDFINPAALDSANNILYSNGTLDETEQINRYVLGANSATKTTFKNLLLNSEPTVLKVSSFTPTTLFVGTETGKLFKVADASTSPIWTQITGPYFYGSISSIGFGATENDLYVTFYNYGVISIFYSANGGTTWVSKEGDLPDLPVRSIMVNPLIPNEVIIGTELGVWATEDISMSSPNWTQSQNGMKDVKVMTLDLGYDNTVLAATYGRGLFTGQFKDNGPPLTVDEFVLNDPINVYPTVSNGQFKITSTDNIREGELRIFDINGRMVYSKNINFDSSKEKDISLNVSSGMYVLKFFSDELSSTHKIVIQ